MSMLRSSVIRPPRILDVSTYGALAVMGVLGVAGIDAWRGRLVAVTLCAAFGLLYAWSTSRIRSRRAVIVATGLQAVVVACALSLHSEFYEAFGFLLMVLAVHAALVFAVREAAVWIVGLWTIHSAATFAFIPTDAPYVIVFNLGIYLLCGVVGHALRTSVEARDELRVALQQLRDAHDRIRAMAADTERGRLARDLHDSVKQEVFAAGMQIGAARETLSNDPIATGEALDEAAALIRRAASDLGMIIHELRPTSVGQSGLAAAVRSYVAMWNRQSDVDGVVEIESVGRHDHGTEEAVMRVVQEALANVARHSGARSVLVRIIGGEGALELSVSDDGRGFDPQVRSDGYGLASMRERIDELGGTFEVLTAPREGTRIRARIGGAS